MKLFSFLLPSLKAFLTILLVTSLCTSVLGQWSTGPGENYPIATGAQDQSDAVMTSDGSSTFIVWGEDQYTRGKILVQKYNLNGIAQWPAGGVEVASSGVTPVIVSDGSGGVIVAWLGSGNVPSAQRIDSNGSILWTLGGTMIAHRPEIKSNIRAVSDGSGGAIISWTEYDYGQLYAQRIAADGTAQWTAGGVLISEYDNPNSTVILSDGSGGATLAWSSFTGQYKIYAQRVNASGAVLWTENGVEVCSTAGDQSRPALIDDGSGGVVISWHDARVEGDNIYAQRLNNSGARLWTTTGVGVATAIDDQKEPAVLALAEGFLFTWQDRRSGDYDIYSQFLNTSGVARWTANGIPVAVAAGNQEFPRIISDKSDGAVISWVDPRSGGIKVYAQRIDANGVVQWHENGLQVSAGGDFDPQISMINSGNSGNVLISWTDRRAGNRDVYAQFISIAGNYSPAPVISAFAPAEGAVGTSVTITGNGFNTTPGDNIVFFGSTSAIVTAASSSSLNVTVPAGASYQPISVLNTATGLTAYSSKPFATTFTPDKGSIAMYDFPDQENFAVAGDPNTVAVADLDGDGKPDLVTANISHNTISVLHNTSASGTISASSFAEKVDFPTGQGPVSVSIADLNGDGKPDIAVSNQSDHTVSVFLNTASAGSISSSSFATKVDFTTGTQPGGLAIGDLDGDGKADIAVTNNGNNSVSVLRNTSLINSITFAAKQDFTTGGGPVAVAIADIDRDGKRELVAANWGGSSVSVLHNTSSPGIIDASSFASKIDFLNNASMARNVVIGDIDGDGKPDIAVASQSGILSVHRNTSTAGSITSSSLDPAWVYTAGAGALNLSIGDLNGDGKPDIAVASTNANAISVFHNTATSGTVDATTFASKVDVAMGDRVTAVAISDLDGDGKADLMGLARSNRWVSVFRNKPLSLPVITSFSPATAPAGATVTISGANFNETLSENIVFFGAVRASLTAASTTTLTATVPEGATYAPITVLNNSNGRVAYSKVPFLTTFTPNKDGFATTDFETKVDFGTGNAPQFVAVGDLDGDGKPDLAVANYSSNTVSVLRNTGTPGNPGFAAKVDFTTGISPFGVAIGDLNADGKPDLAITSGNDHKVAVLRNTSSTGTIAFAAKIDIATGGQPMFATIADFDNDGKPDLATANYSGNSITVLRNLGKSGSMEFGERKDFSAGTNPSALAAGDLDGDGKIDLAVNNMHSTTVLILRNTGTPGTVGFAFPASFTTGGLPVSLAIGDLDGDSKPDLAVASQNESAISVLRNTGSPGTLGFATKINFATGSSTYGVAIGDFDGDGKPDLAAQQVFSATIALLRNTSSAGSMSFGTKVLLGTGSITYSLAVGDIDGDGKSDVMTSNSNDGTVSVLRNNPVFPPPVITSFTPVQSPAGATVTITGSGFNVTPASNIIFFGGIAAVPTASSPTSLTVTIPAGARYGDITVLNTYTNLVGTSTKPFTPTFPGLKSTFAPADFSSTTETTLAQPNVTAMGDLDGDGKADLVIGYEASNKISVFRNTGTSGTVSFATRIDLTAGNGPGGVTIADLDGDGKLEIISGNRGSATVSVFRNTSSPGTISFVAAVSFATASGPFLAAVRDLDGDGRQDLVSVNNAGNISVLRNTGRAGHISFAAAVNTATGSGATDVNIADIDGDGAPDIAVANQNANTVSVLRNTSVRGTISFAAKEDLTGLPGAVSVVIGDIDGDGKSDLGVANYNDNSVSVFRNNSSSGSISFAPKVNFTVGAGPGYIALADLDGDGKPDITAADYGDITVSLLRNSSTNGAVAFDERSVLTTGTSSNPIFVTAGDVDGDGKTDLAVTTFGTAKMVVFKNNLPSANAGLSALAISEGTLNPVFVSGTLAYTASVPNSTTSLTLTPSRTEGSATIKVNGITVASGTASANIALAAGDNTISTVVTAGDGNTTKTYTVVVTRALSADAALSSIALSEGTLSPVFAPGTTAYTASVPNVITSATLTPIQTETTATIKVNGLTVASGSASGSVPLNVGDNTITAVVTAGDGTTTKTYTVLVTRAPSADATLSSIALSEGTLSPVFAPGTIAYSASVPNTITSVTLIAAHTESNASIKVNNVTIASGAASGNINLAVGVNTIIAEVTAPDGITKKTYTVVISRAASADASLSALATSAGTISPAFAPGTANYTSSVASSVGSVTIIPTVGNGEASVRVNGTAVSSGSVSGPLSLNTGDNTITVLVTAGDGTTKTYTLTVTRPSGLSSVAKLSGLSLSSGTLNTSFAAAIRAYTVSLPYSVSSLALTPAVEQANATVKVNGTVLSSGTASSPIPLNVGSNTVTIEVTAQDGTSIETYTLTATRAAAAQAAGLSSLTVSAGAFSPAFAAGTMSYSLFVNNAVSSTTVTAGTENAGATIKVNGIAVQPQLASGNISFSHGVNTISILVTAEDGASSKTYTVKIIRLAPDQTLTDQSGGATVNNTVKEVVVISPSQPITVSIPPGTSTVPTVNYGNIVSGGSGTIPQTTITSSLASVEIPGGTTVSGTSTAWTGTISAPKVSDYQFPKVKGQTIVKGLVIEVGDENVSLSFSKAVRLVLYGQAGMRVARVHNKIYTEIATIGDADTQAAGDALPANESFKINVGADLVIWTKGFSQFITFVESVNLDEAVAAADLAELTLAKIVGANATATSVTVPLTLPLIGTGGSAITWVSDKPGTISHDGGTVNRPVFGSGSVAVNVTAMVIKGTAKETVTFTLTVPELPNQAPTLNVIPNQASCYTPAVLTVALRGISAGPESGQTTTLSVTSNNPTLLTGLGINSATGVLTYTPLNTAGGVATITVTVTDNGGTANGGVNTLVRTFTITVNPLPVVQILNSLGTSEVSKGLTLTLRATGGTIYSWANAAGIIGGQNTGTLTIRPAISTAYTVAVTNANGCVSVLSINIKVVEDYKALEINNLMSPNGDGVNDALVIQNLDMYPNNVVKVFDRAGRVIYQRQNYTNDWAGTFQGSPLAEGTYYYVVDFGVGKKVLKGFVSIVN